MKSDTTKTANSKSFGVIATSSNGQADKNQHFHLSISALQNLVHHPNCQELLMPCSSPQRQTCTQEFEQILKKPLLPRRILKTQIQREKFLHFFQKSSYTTSICSFNILTYMYLRIISTLSSYIIVLEQCSYLGNRKEILIQHRTLEKI